MYDNIYKGGCVFFAELRDDGDHPVYVSAYGKLASELLKKYVEGQKADNEKLFAKWDKSVQEAISKIGFTASHQIEDGHIYITTYQGGVVLTSKE